MTFQLGRDISFRGTAAFLYNTDHALTAESEGRDARTAIAARTPTSTGIPTSTPTRDRPGGRFYASGSRDLHFTATINFTF